MNMTKIDSGIVINEQDSSIDKVLARADKEGNVILRQGDDYIILNPPMAAKVMETIEKLTTRVRSIVPQLIAASLFGANIYTRLDLWELGVYTMRAQEFLKLYGS